MKIDGVNAPPREVVQGIPAAAGPRPTIVSAVRPQVSKTNANVYGYLALIIRVDLCVST